MSDQITAWSYSRLKDYVDCPKKAFFKHVKKMKSAPGAALVRGTEVHGHMESYVTKATRTLPKGLLHANLVTYVKELRKKAILVEQELAFDVSWHPVDWFARNAWCRVKEDVLVPPQGKDKFVLVTDWKTGKVKDEGEYDEQLELYQLTGLILYPEAEYAKAELVFTDHGEIIPAKRMYRPADVDTLKKAWVKKVTPLLNDKKFIEKPGNACRFCDFKKAKGGPCKY